MSWLHKPQGSPQARVTYSFSCLGVSALAHTEWSQEILTEETQGNLLLERDHGPHHRGGGEQNR